MAMADEPTTVGTGQEWAAAGQALPRVPIFVTANDLTALYAPLVREGRMDKFYYQPTANETLELLRGIFEQLGEAGARTLLETFPRQVGGLIGVGKGRGRGTRQENGWGGEEGRQYQQG